MLVLALDTATASVVVGVVEIDPAAASSRHTSGVRAARTVASANRHAETLGQVIPSVLREAGVAISDLAAVVVGLGPGPFTGLRVGVMTAAALGDALGRPVYGVCTHDAIAATYAARTGTLLDAGPEADGFAVVTDARRRECYWADYDTWGVRISGPHVQRPTDVLARPDWPSDRLVIGDPAFSDALGQPVRPAEPEASGLAFAARRLTVAQAPGPLAPLYLRRPDATPPAPRKLVTPA